MQSKILNIINQISRKRKIKYKFVYGNECVGFFSGFNDAFAEFLDITFYIDDNNIAIYVVPQITFENLKSVESIDKIEVVKLDDGKIKFSLKLDYRLIELKEKVNGLYDLIFSKKVTDYYFHLLIENWKNKHNK